MAWLSKFKNYHNFTNCDCRNKFVLAVVASLIGTAYLLHSTRILSFSTVNNSDSNAVHEPKFIYLPVNQKTCYQENHEESDCRYRIKDLPWIFSRKPKKDVHLTLLDLTQNKDRKVRQNAVKKLAELSDLDDSQYCAIAQASDLKTAIGIARNLAATQKLFLPPPLALLDLHHKPFLGDYYDSILNSLPECKSSECVNYLTDQARKNLYFYSGINPYTSDMSVSYADATVFGYRVRKQTLKVSHAIKFLDALLAHSIIPEHRDTLVQNGVLALLHRILQQHPKNDELKSVMAQIIGNIALSEEQHNAIFNSGWIRILAMWLKKSKVMLNLPATRALANMDMDQENYVPFEDGLYLLYPQFRHEDLEIDADVVFIHGVMGGAFRTWRQFDKKKPPDYDMQQKLQDDVSINEQDIINMNNYTYCWPKDWLSVNFPHIRILAVDYVSHVSEWKTKCSADKEKRDVRSRANSTLKKLIAAGIGKRPIIWVSHSMGGILVKQMLLDSEKSEDLSVNAIAKQTSGVVFYSVPHKGTEFAKVYRSVMMLLQPSVETRELKQGSPYLLTLHKEFLNLVEKYNISVLSFGELEQSHISINWRALIVSLESANPGIGHFVELPFSHLNTCKPETQESPNYALLVEFLSNLLPKDVPQVTSEPIHKSKDEIAIFIASSIT